MAWVHIPKCACPYCERSINDVTVDGDVPIGSDLTMCQYCESMLVFNDDLTVRKPTDEELASIDIILIDRMRKMVHDDQMPRELFESMFGPVNQTLQ